jgi:hypothetical protein
MSTPHPKEFFWQWFIHHQTELEAFIQNPNRDYAIYHEMTETLQKFSELLYPEITVNDEGNYVLIITPNGISDGIEPTREIVAAAPVIDRWEIVRFRQPRDEVSLEHDGLHYEADDIEIIAQINEQTDKADVLIFIRNMNHDPRKYQTLAFLYLDHVLGEFNVITRIGYIDFKHLEADETVEDSISLLELRKLIEDHLY